MIAQHLVLGFLYGLSISFISWIIGMLINSLLKRTEYYKKLSNLNFIPSSTLNKSIGLSYFKWTVKNTFFKFFNQKIKLNTKTTDLNEIRHEMTLAEVSHLIGFIFVVVVAVYMSFSKGIFLGISIMIANIFMNLYPSLLQQENKRRIDRLIRKQ